MSICKTTSMKFTSRASVKIGDSYYTFESVIEKAVPDNISEEDYNSEKQLLWDECNGEVDNQIEDVLEIVKSKRK